MGPQETPTIITLLKDHSNRMIPNDILLYSYMSSQFNYH